MVSADHSPDTGHQFAFMGRDMHTIFDNMTQRKSRCMRVAFNRQSRNICCIYKVDSAVCRGRQHQAIILIFNVWAGQGRDGDTKQGLLQAVRIGGHICRIRADQKYMSRHGLLPFWLQVSLNFTELG